MCQVEITVKRAKGIVESWMPLEIVRNATLMQVPAPQLQADDLLIVTESTGPEPDIEELMPVKSVRIL